MMMIHAAIILTAALAATDVKWQRMPDLFLGTFNAAASTSGDKLVITGGIGQTGETLNWVQVFDPAKNRWAANIQFDTGRCNHAQVTLGDGRIFIVGGKTGNVTKQLTPTATAAVIDLAAGKAHSVPDLPRSMTGPTAHLLQDGTVLAIGGRSAAVFDPGSERWSRFINLRQSRTDHASLMMDDGRVLVAAGAGRDTLELIDPAAGISQLLSAKLPWPLDDLALAPLDAGRAWLLGGQDTRTGHTVDQTWIIDIRNPRKTIIEPGPSLAIAGGVADHAVAVMHNWVFVLGGETEDGNGDTELNQARILDRAKQQVWRLPDMKLPHDDAVALPYRRGVVIIGGYYRRNSPFKSLKIPTATPVVRTLQLPAARAGQGH